MISKYAVSNYLLSSSKRLQLPNPFHPLSNQIKSALGSAWNPDPFPLGLRAPQPLPLHHRAMRFMNVSENQKYF